MKEIQDAIFSGDIQKLNATLALNPALAKEEIPLPDNPAKASPLHRICDGVFSGSYSEDVALLMAQGLLEHGANVNPSLQPGQDSPMTAACSLHCDQLALYYLDNGANIHHRGCHGGTPLHWASWCGRDLVVARLIEAGAAINLLCTDFKSTPLFWAIHGYKFGGNNNQHHQARCVSILLDNGADAAIPNFEGYLPVQLLDEKDVEMRSLLIR